MAPESRSTQPPDAPQAAGRTLIAEGAGYTLVEVAQQALALLMLPVFFFFLTAADFGVITLSTVLTQFGTALGTLGFDFSIMRLYFTWSDEERARITAGVVSISLLWSILLAAAAHVLLTSFNRDADAYWPLTLGWWAGLILSIRGVPLSLVRVQGAIGRYALFVLGGAIMQMIVQALCVVYGMGALGYMLGYAGGAAASTAIAFVAVRGECRWRHARWRLPQEIVSYTLRVLPSVLVGRFLAVADRLVLARWVSTEALGVYGAASRFTTPVKFLTGGFKMALAPVLSRQEQAGRLDDAFAQVGRLIVLGMMFVGGCVAIGVWLIQFTPWRADAADLQRLVMLLLVAQFLAGLSAVGQLRLYYSRWPSAAAAIVSVNGVALLVGLALLVPRAGATGAAIAELAAGVLAMAALLAITVAMTRKVAPWSALSAPLLTFAPAVISAWLLQGVPQLAVFAVTLAGYAGALVLSLRRQGFMMPGAGTP